MNGRKFIRKVKKLGRENDVAVSFDKAHGKGSHGTLNYGDKRTTVKHRSKEIGPGLFSAMCDQLGIDPTEL